MAEPSEYLAHCDDPRPAHTPGPWIVTSPNAGSLSREQAEANARLIAAAPELLEACKLALKAYEAEISLQHSRGESVAIDMLEMFTSIRQAIAKATGGQA